MKKALLIQSLIIIGLLLNSCNLFSAGNQTETNNTSDSDSSQGKEAEPTESETDQDSAEITQSPEPIQSEISSVAGLRRATDPDDFVQQRGVTPGENRSDPFTLFPVPLQKNAQSGNQPIEPSQSAEPTRTVEPNQPVEPTQPQPQPQPQAPPQPKLARGVAVQGALKIGNESVVILRAPNEKTSRYVRPGQFIANGQVLVKRINMEQRPTPTVVLKEVGVNQEVTKSVEKEVAVGATTVQNQSTMELPPPPPQVNVLSKASTKQ